LNKIVFEPTWGEELKGLLELAIGREWSLEQIHINFSGENKLKKDIFRAKNNIFYTLT
jgi:hypothetical protein